MVLQNYQNFKEITSNMFYLLHLNSYIIKIKEFTQYSKKEEFPNRKKNLAFKGI